MSSMHALQSEFESRQERLFVVVDPRDSVHHALQRALITAPLRPAVPRVHVFVSVDRTGGVAGQLAVDDAWVDTNIRIPLARHGIDPEIEFSWTDPWLEAVLASARAFQPDIILLPLHRTNGQSPLRLSNRKWSLLRMAESPVLLVRPEMKSRRETILAAVNFQATSNEQRALNLRILEQAGRIAERYDAQLHVVNAWLDSLHYPAHGDLIRASGLGWNRIHVDQGYTDHVVARVASAIDADIVVLGTLNQRGKAGSLRRGNTASRVIEAVNVDTLVVN